MLKPKSKILLAFAFCFLTGMVFGGAATALDYDDKKFGVLMTLFGILVALLTVGYIITVFKTIHIQSRISKLLEDVCNYSHFD